MLYYIACFLQEGESFFGYQYPHMKYKRLIFVYKCAILYMCKRRINIARAVAEVWLKSKYRPYALMRICHYRLEKYGFSEMIKCRFYYIAKEIFNV